MLLLGRAVMDMDATDCLCLGDQLSQMELQEHGKLTAIRIAGDKPTACTRL